MWNSKFESKYFYKFVKKIWPVTIFEEWPFLKWLMAKFYLFIFLPGNPELEQEREKKSNTINICKKVRIIHVMENKPIRTI